MKGFLFWQCWLFLFGLITVVFGMGMALLNHNPLFAVSDAQVNPVPWGANPFVLRNLDHREFFRLVLENPILILYNVN
jgi:hypothetical protein